MMSMLEEADGPCRIYRTTLQSPIAWSYSLERRARRKLPLSTVGGTNQDARALLYELCLHFKLPMPTVAWLAAPMHLLGSSSAPTTVQSPPTPTSTSSSSRPSSKRDKPKLTPPPLRPHKEKKKTMPRTKKSPRRRSKSSSSSDSSSSTSPPSGGETTTGPKATRLSWSSTVSVSLLSPPVPDSAHHLSTRVATEERDDNKPSLDRDAEPDQPTEASNVRSSSSCRRARLPMLKEEDKDVESHSCSAVTSPIPHLLRKKRLRRPANDKDDPDDGNQQMPCPLLQRIRTASPPRRVMEEKKLPSPVGSRTDGIDPTTLPRQPFSYQPPRPILVPCFPPSPEDHDWFHPHPPPLSLEVATMMPPPLSTSSSPLSSSLSSLSSLPPSSQPVQ